MGNRILLITIIITIISVGTQVQATERDLKLEKAIEYGKMSGYTMICDEQKAESVIRKAVLWIEKEFPLTEETVNKAFQARGIEAIKEVAYGHKTCNKALIELKNFKWPEI